LFIQLGSKEPLDFGTFAAQLHRRSQLSAEALKDISRLAQIWGFKFCCICHLTGQSLLSWKANRQIGVLYKKATV